MSQIAWYVVYHSAISPKNYLLYVISYTLFLHLFFRNFNSPWTWRCNPGEEIIGGHKLRGRCVKELYQDLNDVQQTEG